MTVDHDFTDEQLLLTTVQAAKVLGIGRTTVYQLIKDGDLRAVHIARSCRISWAELERYVARLDAAAAGAAAHTDPSSDNPERRWHRVVAPNGRRALIAVDADAGAG